ncbi:MAG: ABC transporter ATP-binding protein [Candidatus Aerophobetes bacterium]|nr:ABC transporter ATP-binding protein [Candidatus Aerophobetes bacterium]
MATVELRNVSNNICQGVNLKIAEGELLVLTGPTGAGKTTLLNIIAGLVDYSGSILFDGEPIDATSPQRRRVGYLFQDLALFPHLNVYANIAYGLNTKKKLIKKVEERVSSLLKLMNIEYLKDRYPKNLSGGEKQKVALARTLAISPRVLLLDEPFNNIDLRTRKYLRIELRSLQRGLSITTIFVTHNLIEAEEMGDRIAVLYGGRLEQVTSPRELFFNPRNERVVDFIGRPNILKCDSYRVLREEVAEVKCGEISVIVPYEGEKISKVLISPRDIYVSAMKPSTSVMNGYWGTIIKLIPLTSIVRFQVKVKDIMLLAELPRDLFQELGLKLGKKVFIILKFRGIRVC